MKYSTYCSLTVHLLYLLYTLFSNWNLDYDSNTNSDSIIIRFAEYYTVQFFTSIHMLHSFDTQFFMSTNLYKHSCNHTSTQLTHKTLIFYTLYNIYMHVLDHCKYSYLRVQCLLQLLQVQPSLQETQSLLLWYRSCW